MKNVYILIFILMTLFSSVAQAEDYVEPGAFTWGIGVGGASIGSGFGTAYNGGYGVDGDLGFILNKNMALLLSIDAYVFNTNVSQNYSGEVNFLPSLCYTFTGIGIKPYLIGGIGLNQNIYYYQINYLTTAETSTTSFAFGLGAGVAIPINDHMDVYLQAKYEDALASGGSFSYFPMAVGVQFVND